MDTGDKAVPVTQHEFYSALVLVWTFITIALSTTVFSGARAPVRSTASVIYLAASLLMVINYAVKSWRGNVSRKGVVIAVVLAVVALVVGPVAYFVGQSSN